MSKTEDVANAGLQRIAKNNFTRGKKKNTEAQKAKREHRMK